MSIYIFFLLQDESLAGRLTETFWIQRCQLDFTADGLKRATLQSKQDCWDLEAEISLVQTRWVAIDSACSQFQHRPQTVFDDAKAGSNCYNWPLLYHKRRLKNEQGCCSIGSFISTWLFFLFLFFLIQNENLRMALTVSLSGSWFLLYATLSTRVQFGTAALFNSSNIPCHIDRELQVFGAWLFSS